MVGAKIRDLRKKLALTQEQLAGQELTKSYVSQVELGRIHPSTKALEIMATRLGKPLGYFLENGDDMRTIEVLLKAAQALWNSGRLDEGMLGLKEALTLAERTGREDILARIKATMGRLEMAQGNLPSALDFLEESLSLINPHEYPAQAVEIANTLGVAAARSGSFHKAMNSFQQALEYSQELTPDESDIRAEAAQHYGDFCYSQKQWISALELYSDAIEHPGNDISTCRRAELYSRVASTHWQLGHHTEALDAIEKTNELLSHVSDLDERAAIEADLARVLIDVGRFHEAHDLLTQALHAFERLSFHEAQASVLDSLLQLAAAASDDEWLNLYSQRVLRHPDIWPWHSVRLYALRLLARREVALENLERAEQYLQQAFSEADAQDQFDLECEYYLIRSQQGDRTAVQKLWQHIIDPKLRQPKNYPFTPRLPKITTQLFLSMQN